MNNKILLLFVFLLPITFSGRINGQISFVNLPTTIEKNKNLTIRVFVLNDTAFVSDADVHITIYYPNSSIFINNEPMMNGEDVGSYIYKVTIPNIYGEYLVKVEANGDGVNTFAMSSITVTKDYGKYAILLVFVIMAIGLSIAI